MPPHHVVHGARTDRVLHRQVAAQSDDANPDRCLHSGNKILDFTKFKVFVLDRTHEARNDAVQQTLLPLSIQTYPLTSAIDRPSPQSSSSLPQCTN